MPRELIATDQVLAILGETPSQFASSLEAFMTQRRRLLEVLARLSPDGWTRSATVLGGGSPLALTVHRYASRLARHERTHWRQLAKTAASLPQG